MKLALFGATGKTGQAIIQLANRFGCEISAHSRRAGMAKAVVGPIATTADEVIAGCDAVVICLGPRQQEVFLADATAEIVSACQRQGVKRIICVTGAMVGDYPKNQSTLLRWYHRYLNKRQAPLLADKAKQEDIIKRSGLNWTLVKPPRLTNRTAHQHYIAGSSIPCGLFSSISRQTLAYDIGKSLANQASFGMVRFIKGIKD